MRPGGKSKIMAGKKKKQSSTKGRQSKTVEAAADKGSRKFSVARVKEFSGEVKAEFDKIVWPDKKVTAGLTGFVILLVIVLSAYLGTVDLLLGKLVTMVLR
jgi:preprotein translocase subunit SecE